MVLRPVWVDASDLKKVLSETDSTELRTDVGTFPLFLMTRRFFNTKAASGWLNMGNDKLDMPEIDDPPTPVITPKDLPMVTASTWWDDKDGNGKDDGSSWWGDKETKANSSTKGVSTKAVHDDDDDDDWDKMVAAEEDVAQALKDRSKGSKRVLPSEADKQNDFDKMVYEEEATGTDKKRPAKKEDSDDDDEPLSKKARSVADSEEDAAPKLGQWKSEFKDKPPKLLGEWTRWESNAKPGVFIYRNTETLEETAEVPPPLQATWELRIDDDGENVYYSKDHGHSQKEAPKLP